MSFEFCKNVSGTSNQEYSFIVYKFQLLVGVKVIDNSINCITIKLKLFNVFTKYFLTFTITQIRSLRVYKSVIIHALLKGFVP